MIIKCRIDGYTPLMFDRFQSGILETRTTVTTNKGSELSPLEQAKMKLFLYDKGHPKAGKPYLPSNYLLAAVIDAGRFIKVGKRQLSTRDGTIVTSFMSLLGLDYPIISKEGWRVDARPIVNQVTKSRVMCYRPIFDDWAVEFEIDLDTKEGRPSTVRELVDRAGRAIGVGVLRPARKGGYGQWKVTKWVEQEEKVPLAEAAE